MVQDQRRFNLLLPSQLPHPSPSPTPKEPRALFSPLLPYQGAGEGDSITTGNPARRHCQCGLAGTRTGSSAPGSSDTTLTSISSTSVSAHQPHHKT